MVTTSRCCASPRSQLASNTIAIASVQVEVTATRNMFTVVPRRRRSVSVWSRCAPILLLVLLIGAAKPQAAADTYCNPIDVLLADPFIDHEGDTYYLYGTASEYGLPVWTSKNLVNWQLRGHAFRRSEQSWSRKYFWAPELFKHRGKYYLHFTACHEDRQHRIVLAEADSPLGPFREIKAPWFATGRDTIEDEVL